MNEQEIEDIIWQALDDNQGETMTWQAKQVVAALEREGFRIVPKSVEVEQ